jgi:hypothetical protein
MTKQNLNDTNELVYREGQRVSTSNIAMATRVFELLQSEITDVNSTVEMQDDGNIHITNDNLHIIVYPRGGDRYKIDTFVGERRAISLTPRSLIDIDDAVQYCSNLVKAQANIPAVMDILNQHQERTEGEGDMEPVHSEKWTHILKNGGVEPAKEESVEDLIKYYERNKDIEPGDHVVNSSGYPVPTKQDKDNFGKVPVSALRGLKGKVVTKEIVPSAALDLMGNHKLGLVSLNEHRNPDKDVPYANTMGNKKLVYIRGVGCTFVSKEDAKLINENKSTTFEEIKRRAFRNK